MSTKNRTTWSQTAAIRLFLVALIAGLAFTSCKSGDGEDGEEGDEENDGTGLDPSNPNTVDISLCAAENGPFSVDITNKYLPYTVGKVTVLEGMEGGTDAVKVQYTTLDETRDIMGVTTRVVEEQLWEDGNFTGKQLHFVAQASDGTVCFYGTEGVGTEEEWMAGEDNALPAILMPGAPSVGQQFEVVHHPPNDVEAVEVTRIGESVETTAGTYTDTITLVAGEVGPTEKKFAAGIGMIYDDGVVLISTTY
jgi:hypothetical protein